MHRPRNKEPTKQPLNLQDIIMEEVARVLREVFPTTVGLQIEVALKGLWDQPLVFKILNGNDSGDRELGSPKGITFEIKVVDCEFTGIDGMVVALMWLTHT